MNAADMVVRRFCPVRRHTERAGVWRRGRYFLQGNFIGLKKDKWNLVRMEKRKIFLKMFVCFFLAFAFLSGCGEKKDNLTKIKDLEFTVIAEENIPEELLKAIGEKKTEGFKITYQDKGFVYICAGYGEQETGGYSITVNGLYETENAVYFDTTLTGPRPGENEGKKGSKSYPYIVVKTEMIDKPVVFE